ncbi:aminotransferase class I/II-fold pyridoxal phosphate-dependent enzyme [Pontiella agarivorans]|uniref:Aminotransferase n=1 Tax=Pontiella agarivorans TaxID=3038953 RepID=A0ABU5MYS3_9BACT|nr:aminotransferase class I/II-fold pyridoxal phosphate-dependent enzyme [Pontiella agarivorans]MDZ8119236.1 aminotransferase class I/II-fold pyridoxal phosphate-dependent enzyme [Pontiella agarivorans]
MSDSKSLHSKISKVVHEIPRSGIRDFFDIVSSREDVISLGIGEPDFVTPWHIREAATLALERGQTSYTSNMGLLSLRRGISQYVEKKTGIRYVPEEEVLVTVGVSEGLDLAVRALVEPGDEVLYHEPSYVSYNPLIQFAYGKPVAIQTRKENGFRLTRQDLEQNVSEKTKVLLLNYPNNPTGVALSKADVEDIAAFAIEHDLIVLTDEIYDELTYDKEHYSVISVPGMRERTIYLHGFSKAWAMTGFRMGFTCAPPELTEAMMKIHQYTMLCAPILSQEASVEALRSSDADIAYMKAEYKKRRNYIHSSFEEMGIPCIYPDGAFYAFADISKFGMTSQEFALHLLDEQNVACVPGTAFGACGEGFIRCSYATSLEEIKEAMVRIARFIEKL